MTALASTKSYTILHTESSLGWGGQEHRILAEAQAMRARGHRLLLACDPRGELGPRARQAGLQVRPLTFGGWRNPSAWQGLWTLLQQQPPDILNTHSSLDSWVGLLAWRSAKPRPLLVRTRHLTTPVRGSWPTRYLYQAPAAIITTSQAAKELLIKSVAVPGSRIFSIPTGVSLREFAPREADGELRGRLQIPAASFIFGCVAVLRSWKGHLFLLEALKELRGQGVDAYLVLVGDGPQRAAIEARGRELGLAERLRLVGHQEEVASWFALMDAVVLASYANEGVPQALLQALAMAKPVLGTAVGGIPEVILPGETGLLAPPRDALALAQGLRTLMDNPELAQKLGQQGRELVQQKFSLERMAAAVEEVYDWARGESGSVTGNGLPSSS
jgi:glycosyltransferase involved in cell wall biosynthesis